MASSKVLEEATSKSLVASKTAWAALLGFVPLVQDVLTSAQEAGFGSLIDVKTASVVASLGAALAIFFRKRAVRKIDGVV